jgi:hypothetical protein
MNQHLLGKMRQLGVANLGNSLAITCDWRLSPAQLNDSELTRVFLDYKPARGLPAYM